MKQHRILVVGSSNTDMVIRTDHLPVPGETILGGTFFMNPGGKGANQAVAVARLEGDVAFICKIGKDVFGYQSQQLFADEGIDTSYIFFDAEYPSGIAMITVDDKGENSITVASGANMNLTPTDIETAKDAIEEADIILLQLEIPMETVEYVARTAAKQNKKVILNPAPARPLSRELLKSLYLITPNETEAELLTGQKITNVETAVRAAASIKDMGVENVIITMGSRGALIYAGSLCALVPAYKVKAVDTTAAGDIFNGALVMALAEGRDWIEAARFACKASAIAVTRAGAQSSAPYRNEVDSFLADEKEVETSCTNQLIL